MKKTETAPMGQVLGFPVLLGLGVTLLLMAAGSLLILSGKAESGQIPMLALGCLGLGCLCASFLAARRAVRSRLVWGVAAGAILFGCLAALSLAWLGEPVRLTRVLTNLAVSMAAAFLGGMLGAGMKRKKKKTNGRKFP